MKRPFFMVCSFSYWRGDGRFFHLLFLGSSERDYLGRTYIYVPNDVDVDLTTDAVPECFLPKKLIHTWYVIFPLMQ